MQALHGCRGHGLGTYKSMLAHRLQGTAASPRPYTACRPSLCAMSFAVPQPPANAEDEPGGFGDWDDLDLDYSLAGNTSEGVVSAMQPGGRRDAAAQEPSGKAHQRDGEHMHLPQETWQAAEHEQRAPRQQQGEQRWQPTRKQMRRQDAALNRGRDSSTNRREQQPQQSQQTEHRVERRPRQPPDAASAGRERAEFPADAQSVRGTAAGTKGAYFHDAAVTTVISRCNSASGLLKIWEQHGWRFNHVHYAAIISRLAKVLTSGTARPADPTNEMLQELLQHLDAGYARNIRRYGAREVCMTVWAWGKLRHIPSDGAWRATCSVLCQVQAPIAAQAAAAAAAQQGAAQAAAAAATAELNAAQAASPAAARAGQGPAEWLSGAGGTRRSGLLHTATPQGLAMLCWGLSQVGCSDDGVWAAVEVAVLRSLPQLQPRDLSNIAWAFATSNRHSMLVFTALAQAAAPRIVDLTAQDMANLAWAYAASGHPYRPLFDAIAPAAAQLLHAFTPQGLANLAWAFAQARVPAPVLFQGIVREAAGRLPGFQAGQLAMLAWAVARSGEWHTPLLSSISSMVQADMQVFRTKEIVMVLWSLAHSGVHDDPLFVMAPPALMHRLQQAGMSPQDLAHTLWALAVADKYHPAFFAAACDACLSRWSSFCASSAYALDTLVNSMASCGHYDTRLCSRVAQMLSSMRIQVPGSAGEEHGLVPSSEQQGAGDAGFGADARAWRGSAGAARGAGGEEPPLLVLQPSQAAAMLSSLARLSHRDDAACAAVAREMQRAVRSSPEQVQVSAICNCLWAFAVMDYQDLPTISTLAASISQLEADREAAAEAAGVGDGFEAGREQQLSQQLRLVNKWQARRGGSLPQRHLLQQLLPGAWALRRSGLELPGDMPLLREAMQLLQAWLWLKDMRMHKADTVASHFPKHLLQAAMATWRRAAVERQTISGLQQQVHMFLQTHMKLKPQLELLSEDGMFSVDLVVAWHGNRVALEVNGPWHYAANMDMDAPTTAATSPGKPGLGKASAVVLPCVPVPRALGYKQLRDKFLAARGYAVANLSWLEWQAVQGSPDHTKRYLAALLDAAVMQQGGRLPPKRAGPTSRGRNASVSARPRRVKQPASAPDAAAAS